MVMKTALIVPRLYPDPAANLAALLRLCRQAADAGADLALMPEAALTSLSNNDDPAHDLPLGQPIPGPATAALTQVARQRHIWLALGLLERVGGRLYDAAVLLSPDGDIPLHYRRIHPGWHGPHADPTVYGHGAGLPAAETPWGRMAFLICGDLFDDGLVRRVRALAPDWLLYPFARDYVGETPVQTWWDREEKAAYLEQVRRVGVTTLMVNYWAGEGLPDDTSFGGAMVVSGDGGVCCEMPLEQEGILFAEL